MAAPTALALPNNTPFSLYTLSLSKLVGGIKKENKPLSSTNKHNITKEEDKRQLLDLKPPHKTSQQTHKS
ncbi:hypothetical protein QVD17_23007 [Tagetes erecta]|uniref:Uncharacterized protein n=1 Tax=Tagetes erecta TaxID=13708 RepID=A0AAD8NUA0_TARER|nr:hypothetical protein QVD17_23007 [Tagetes erecta]